MPGCAWIRGVAATGMFSGASQWRSSANMAAGSFFLGAGVAGGEARSGVAGGDSTGCAGGEGEGREGMRGNDGAGEEYGAAGDTAVGCSSGAGAGDPRPRGGENVWMEASVPMYIDA